MKSQFCVTTLALLTVSPVAATPPSTWWSQPEPCPPGAVLHTEVGREIWCALEDGTKHGRSTVWSAGHISSELEYAHGRRHGRAITWNANGQRVTEVEYQDDELHGSAVTCAPPTPIIRRDERRGDRIIGWYTDGQKAEEIVFNSGKIHRTTYCRRLSETLYRHGKEHGPSTLWHDNGQRAMVVVFCDGQPHGSVIGWHANGRRAVEGRFLEGRKHGIWTYWYEFGGGAKVERWSDGQLLETIFRPARTDLALVEPRR